MMANPRLPSYGGLPACADASYNLANPVHVDVGDAWRSYAVWVRLQPTQPIAGHWFLFPDVGLAIELQDSVAISWDGRECAHATSAPTTEVSPSDALLSLFFSLPANVVGATERRAEMLEALHARAASKGVASLQPGDRVWAKWYAKGEHAGSNGWRRATGDVHNVLEDGSVVVQWLHASGRGLSLTTLTRQQAACMLVCAGVVMPEAEGPLLGAGGLVGHRIRIYWPGEDRLYAGSVLDWNEVSGEHLVHYDDGEDWWELLGGEQARVWYVV